MSENKGNHSNLNNSYISHSKQLLINNINSNEDLYEILPQKTNINKKENNTINQNDNNKNNNQKNERKNSRIHCENNNEIENNNIDNFLINKYNTAINEIKRLNSVIARLNEIINSKNNLIQEYQNMTELSKKKINELKLEISNIKKNNNLVNKKQHKKNISINNNDNKLLRNKLNEVEENYHKLFLENNDLKTQLLYNNLLCQQYKKEIDRIKNCSCSYCNKTCSIISCKNNSNNFYQNKINANLCPKHYRQKSENLNKSFTSFKSDYNFSYGSKNDFYYTKTDDFKNCFDKIGYNTLPNYSIKNKNNIRDLNFSNASNFKNGKQTDDLIQYSTNLLSNIKDNIIRNDNILQQH